MKILYGTGNPAKLVSMGRRLSGLGIELIGLKDIAAEIPQIEEDGRTPLENAEKKSSIVYSPTNVPFLSTVIPSQIS